MTLVSWFGYSFAQFASPLTFGVEEMLVHIVMKSEWVGEDRGDVVCAFASFSDAEKYVASQNALKHEAYWIVSVPLTPEG